MNELWHTSRQYSQKRLQKWKQGVDQNLQGVGVCFPYAWLLLFFLIPFLLVLKISLSQAVFALPPFDPLYSWVGDHFLQIRLNFNNFTVLLTEAFYRQALWSSLKVSGAATFFCLILGYGMAYAISRAPTRWRIFFVLLVLLPFWTSFLIRVYAWMSLLSTKGMINQILLYLGMIQEPFSLLDNSYAVCLGITYCYLPFMVLPVYAALEKIDPVYWEAAFDLGAGPWRTFWRVTVPLSQPGVIAGCVLVFVPAMGEFVIPELLGGPDTLMIGRVLWSEFFNNQDWPRACALAVVMTLVFVIPIMIFQRYQQRSL